MATYAIGDVHGCGRSLKALIEKLPFYPHADRLWMVGDLVNRGPDNVGVLRWAMKMERLMGDRFQAVLGNHDLHLLARAAKLRGRKKKDTLRDVLKADDRKELVGWLRRRPLAVEGRTDDDVPILLVHAGLVPDWSVDQTLELAAEVSAALTGSDGDALLERALSKAPSRWKSKLKGKDRRAFVLSTLTRIRMLDKNDKQSDFSGPPDAAPPGLTAWFDHPERRSASHRIVFGHWAALGLRVNPTVTALDSGCVWGGRLSAIRLEDGQIWQQESLDGTSVDDDSPG